MSTCILSIDGGGIMGLIPAMVLGEIEARTGCPAGALFDLVAGTSTGGIIACAVAAGMPALPGDMAMDDASDTALATIEAVARGLIAEQDAALDDLCAMLLHKAAA